MERLTIVVDNGLDEICFEAPSDREGAYNILDIAKHSNQEEMQEILLNIASKLAEYEDIGMTPEEIKYFLKDFGMSLLMKNRELKNQYEEDKKIISKMAERIKKFEERYFDD